MNDENKVTYDLDNENISGLEPGLKSGMVLYHINRGVWAEILYDKSRSKGYRIGVKWLDPSTSSGGPFWNIINAGLDKARFRNVWKIACEEDCPPVPEKYEHKLGKGYEPPNNQGRVFCFWHKKIRTISLYAKEIHTTFHYCPKCKR